MSQRRPVSRERFGGPWEAEDFIRWAGTVVVAIVLLVTAAIEARGKTFHNQYTWIEVGSVGLILGSYATLVWVMRGRRAVGERVERLLGAHHTPKNETFESSLHSAASAPGVLVAQPSGTLYHQKGCAMVLSKATISGDRSAHEAAGRRPCGVCAP